MSFKEKRLSALDNKNRLFWVLQISGWVVMMLLGVAALQSDLAVMWPFLMFRMVYGFLVSLFVLRPLLRHARRRWTFSPAVAVVLLMVLVALVALVDALMGIEFFERLVRKNPSRATRQFYIDAGFFLRSIIYGFWISLYLGINYFIETVRTRLRLARLESETRESELRLLRAQVNPHFLFNALNAVLAEAEKPRRVVEITRALTGYLRFSLQQDGGVYRLGNELTALENYLQVQKIRFEERLEYTIEADAVTRELHVPGALVQPLLENAIKYGQLTSPLPLRIAIRAQALPDGGLRLDVENTGHWMEGGAETFSSGIGLPNLRRRLELIYGSRASVMIEKGGGRVCVTVILPGGEEPRK